MDVKEAILRRSNLRALVKCKECNHYNGNRARSCKNKLCSLSRVAVQRRPKLKIDAVQLVNHGESNLFSVRVRDDVRNFVSITDKVISSDESGTLINRNAICYIDTCKYDSNDVNISCKHIKCALEQTTVIATPLPIKLEILNALKAPDDTKTSWWNQHFEGQSSIPIVQRINATTFVVKCSVSQTFPAGLLHVSFTHSPKPSHACTCKRIKIIMSPSSDSILLENVECDHLLLTFAAILSDDGIKEEFSQHMTAIEKCFDEMPTNDTTPTLHMTSVIDFENLTTTIANDFSTEGVTMPSALIDNLENIELISIPNALDDDPTIGIDFENNLKLEKFQEDSNERHSLSIDNIQIIDDATTNDMRLENLELIDCQVELMDQFKLTECMAFDADEIYSSENNQIGYFDANPISDMTLTEWNSVNGEYSDIFPKETVVDDANSATLMTTTATRTTSTAPRKVRKAAKRTHPVDVATSEIDLLPDDANAPLTGVESKWFTNWLDSVIETINLSMNFADDGQPKPLVFSVSQQFFAMLRMKFSAGTKKKRLPNRTVLLNEGKYKGLTLFAWNFANLTLIQHIFSTENMNLEVVRTFHKVSPNEYKYIDPKEIENGIGSAYGTRNSGSSKPLQKIRPTEYKTFLKSKLTQRDLQQMAQTNKCGLFIVEWIPNVLPKSGYGEMRIRLQFGHMKNNQIIK